MNAKLIDEIESVLERWSESRSVGIAFHPKDWRVIIDALRLPGAYDPPDGYRLVCEKCGADQGEPCGWRSNCPTGRNPSSQSDTNSEQGGTK